MRAYDSGFHDLTWCCCPRPKFLPVRRRWFGFTQVLDRNVVGSLVRLWPPIGCSLKSAQDGGAVLYQQEEGIGLVEKLKAYNLQDQGLDTFEANEQLGHQRDAKLDVAAKLLEDLGQAEVRLMTTLTR